MSKMGEKRMAPAQVERFYTAAMRKPWERYPLGLVLGWRGCPTGARGRCRRRDAQPSTRRVPRGRCRALYAPGPTTTGTGKLAY